MANSVIGALRVMLGMDTAEFESGTTRAQRSAQRFEKDMRRLGGNLQKIGVGMTAALTAPLAAFGVSSFKAASDAAELQSAFDQTFGELSGAMNDWAEQTGNAMGRSTQSMQQLANTFGIFFNQAAPTRAEAAKMSQTFAVLAQDLASFYNVAEEDALAKLRSGLAGESEPLRDFGVFLNEATVAAKAMEMGLAASSKELTEQDKILARYNLILEATKNAQGDVARTADGTANQMRAASDAFQELQVAIGNVLLPVITPLITAFAEIVDALAKLPKGAQTAIVVIAGLAAAAGPLLIALGGIISLAPAIATGFAAISAAALPVTAVVAAVAAAGYLIYENWDKISPVLESIAQGFEDAIGPELRRMIADASAKLTELWNGPLGEAVRFVSETLFQFQMAYLKVLGSSFVQLLEVAGQATSGALDVVLNALLAVSRFLSGDFSGAWRAVVDLVTGVARTIAGVIEALFPGLIQLGKDIIRGIVAGIKAAPGAVRDALMNVVQSGVDTVKDFLGIRSPSLLFMGIGSNIAEGLAIGIENGTGVVGRALAGLTDETEVQTVRIADTFQNMVDRALGSLRRLADGIKGGGFFGILEGIIGIGTTLGGFGLFGKGIQSALQSTPGFATGGAMRLGGMPGLDRNLLSLNGTPIARVSAGETMQIRPANDRGGGSLKVVVTMDESTGALGAFVRNEAGQVVAAAAPGIVAAGAGQAIGRMRAMADRRLA